MLRFAEVDLELLTAWSRSLAEVEDLLGAPALAGSLLPPEFVAGFFAAAKGRAPYLGTIAILDGQIAGSGGFTSAPVDGEVEIGYGVAPEVEGKGVATGIAVELCCLAKGYGAVTVVACTLPEGIASQRVLEKAGFLRAGDVVRMENLGPPSDPGPEVETTVWRFVRQLDAV